MSFQDISPKNQPFSNAFRPLSFQWQQDEKAIICSVIYGLGEYQFSADLMQHDSKADFAHLLNELKTGNPPTTVIIFQQQEEKILLQIRGEGEWLFFSWLQEIAGERELLLEGETSRQQLLSLIENLKEL